MSSQTLTLGYGLAGFLPVQRRLVVAVLLGTAVLAGCASRQVPAPVSDISGGGSAGRAVAVSGASYVVRPGDTLYSIARAHNMSVNTLASLNNITDPTQLAVGQTLRVSGSAPAMPPVAAGGETTAPDTSTGPVTEPVTVPGTGVPAKTTAVARAADANLVSWGWPASGEIIQTFNTSTKGIDIAGAVGSPVVAAADGEVMYVGNGVRGLGNLVLIGHGNKFITAYAHNETLLAKTGTKVKKGDKIATLGQTEASSPRLHFEVRRDGTPVNPLAYLPPK